MIGRKDRNGSRSARATLNKRVKMEVFTVDYHLENGKRERVVC